MLIFFYHTIFVQVPENNIFLIKSIFYKENMYIIFFIKKNFLGHRPYLQHFLSFYQSNTQSLVQGFD